MRRRIETLLNLNLRDADEGQEKYSTWYSAFYFSGRRWSVLERRVNLLMQQCQLRLRFVCGRTCFLRSLLCLQDCIPPMNANLAAWTRIREKGLAWDSVAASKEGLNEARDNG